MISDEEEVSLLPSVYLNVTPTKSKPRNLIAFWILGLCNNFGYVVMLSAAGDILDPDNDSNHKLECTPTSAGTILLADILPALLIKLTGPFINLNTHLQVGMVVFLGVISFILTSFSTASTQWIGFAGVICASLGSGLGEITFLRYSSKYQRNVVSTWSSGTGAAGILGAFAYAALSAFMSATVTLRVMISIPTLLAVAFWVILDHPKESDSLTGIDNEPNHLSEPVVDASSRLSLVEKLRLVRPLLYYMIPLGLVYFAEYFINQGLTEIITFDIFTVKTQYKWYQVCYQVGVFISRSSVNIVHIHKLWLLPVLQIANAIFFTFEAYYSFLPSFWIVVVIIVYEGLLGGASYVNTFYKISEEVAPQYREFSLGVTSLADSLGITCAAFASIWAHNLICANRPPRIT